MAEQGFLTVGSGEGEQVALGPSRFTFIASGEQTGNGHSLILYEAPAGSGSPWHTHAHEDEAFYVLDGTLTFQLGERSFEAGPGSYVFIPRGRRHAFANRGTEPVRALILATPGGLDRYFAEAAALAASADASDEAFAALNQRYGLAFEPPA